MTSTSTRTLATARSRLIIALLAGVLVGISCLWLGAAKFAALGAWDTIVLVYGLWVWLNVWPMNARETKAHAVGENPGRALADIFLLLAAVISLGAVAILIVEASNSTGITKAVEIGLGLASIVLSWAMVQTIYMLKYAQSYYGRPEGGVDFNEQDLPKYTDFAYLAFTLGMTFQVSDTDLQTKEIRTTAIKHALLSYLFGTVIIATTINTLASLSQ